MVPSENFLLLLIRQFAGGPGPVENNLVRFGSAAIFWLALLLIAWTRQKNQNLPREKLLIFGFGFALIRELIMFGLTTVKITGVLGSEGWDIYYYPMEHGLSMASIVVVAGAFLGYSLKDEKLSLRYIQIGLTLTIVALAFSYNQWPKLVAKSPGVHFNETWGSLSIHILSVLLLIIAIIFLLRKRDWLRINVSIAFGSLLISEALFLTSNALTHSTNEVLCPISNAFHILAIPIFGFVYIKEMSIEKKLTEEKLDDYRDHLEELVDERTSMLVAQNEIAHSLSRSLDLETILNMALDKVLAVLSMDVGLIFIQGREKQKISLGAYRGQLSDQDLAQCIKEGCPYENLSRDAIEKKSILQIQTDENLSGFFHIKREQIKSLISIPLVSKDQIVGALTLGSKRKAPLDQTNLELLTAVCNQIGMAVENAYLYHEAEIWAGELSTLHQASVNLGALLDTEEIHNEIVAQTARLTNRPIVFILQNKASSAKAAILAMVGTKSEQLVHLTSAPDVSDLITNLCNQRTSTVISYAQQDNFIPESWQSNLQTKSLLCSPIWNDEESEEFLFILDRDQESVWLPKDVELVESFVSRAAVALENAHLYKQLEWAATLEERQRIAADMHDGLAQTISLLGLKVDQIAAQVPQTSGQLSADVAEVRETVNQALEEARKSIYSLQNTPPQRKSLQDILTTLVDEWRDQQEISIDTTFSFTEPLFLPHDQITQIIPIIQESVINARKHADTPKISINGYQLGNWANISVGDTGKGFDINALYGNEDSHFGLKIMQARAARFGGELNIESHPGVGTTITLSWQTNKKRGDSNGKRKQITTPEKITNKEGEIHV